MKPGRCTNSGNVSTASVYLLLVSSVLILARFKKPSARSEGSLRFLAVRGRPALFGPSSSTTLPTAGLRWRGSRPLVSGRQGCGIPKLFPPIADLVLLAADAEGRPRRDFGEDLGPLVAERGWVRVREDRARLPPRLPAIERDAHLPREVLVGITAGAALETEVSRGTSVNTTEDFLQEHPDAQHSYLKHSTPALSSDFPRSASCKIIRAEGHSMLNRVS